ncbi:MAG: ATP-dependent 6-phosphofructokinase [Rickettsiales bacterium]|nr:ATP-dependent 6-phosphofructokinase [Rickettsiales bacterium]
MVKEIKKIAILTSGGDCAGLNAVMNAVVRRATEKGIEVYGIHDGTFGLIYPNVSYRRLTVKDFQNEFSCIKNAGTILGSVNNMKMENKSYLQYADAFRKGVEELSINSIVVVGGDGSAAIINDFTKGTDINVVLIPKTIDNDTPYTEYSIGFDTARNVCMEMLDMIQTTASSHHRIMVVEVMGRDAGHLALHSAIAASANVCLIPEIPYRYDNVVRKIREIKDQGINYSLVVVSEGCKTENDEIIHVKRSNGMKSYCGFGNYLANKLEGEGNDFIVRSTTLGHLQRGGRPSCFDRITAARFGVHAVDIICEGKSRRMVALKDGKIVDVDLEEAVKTGSQFVDKHGDLVDTAKALGIYVGEI